LEDRINQTMQQFRADNPPPKLSTQRASQNQRYYQNHKRQLRLRKLQRDVDNLNDMGV
jgi:hypothetical protein